MTPEEKLAKARVRNRAYYQAHREHMRAKKKERGDHIKNRYGLTPDALKALYDGQGGKCAICGKHGEHGRMKGGLGVDHDHKTGMVRGLLCYSCNSALGFVNDSPELLHTMIDYIRRNSNE